ALANSLGSFVPIRNPSLSAWRNSSARVCIEMDLSSPLPCSFSLKSVRGSWSQAIDYEGLNVKCLYCGKLGHMRKDCPIKVKKASGHPPPQAEDSQPTPESSNGIPFSQVCPKVGDHPGSSSVVLAITGPSKELSPHSLLKETEEVHRDSGELVSLIREGMEKDHASLLEALNGWISNNMGLNMKQPADLGGYLEDGEIDPEGLASKVVSSKLVVGQEGLNSANCGSTGKRGRKSKQEVVQKEVDSSKQSTLKFDISDSGK
ncbi:hypothetical protein KI387_032608, partial [Taxus chinensis]